MKKLRHIRQDYDLFKLKKSHLTKNPMKLFRQWMDMALDSDIQEPTAFTLCTCDIKGHPSSRILLLKGFDDRGFHFYTNYDSHKAMDMKSNPRVAMNIFWDVLHRQVRVEGTISKMKRKESEAYFRQRPRDSQIGAWVSEQSKELPSRSMLEKRQKKIEKRFAAEETVPCPPNWGGYILSPKVIEFWQGRESRLHDRFRYARSKSEGWKIDRLWP